jgi:uncharacterized HAD superfamily protein
MAKLNYEFLKQENETLKRLEFESQLRKIENLNETNFHIFLAKQVSNLHLIDSGFYFPVATTPTLNSKGEGRFAKQC